MGNRAFHAGLEAIVASATPKQDEGYPQKIYEMRKDNENSYKDCLGKLSPMGELPIFVAIRAKIVGGLAQIIASPHQIANNVDESLSKRC